MEPTQKFFQLALMNPYRPLAPFDAPDCSVGEVQLRNPIVTKAFSFVPMFLAVRSAFFLATIYGPRKADEFTVENITTGLAAWVISGFFAATFAIWYLRSLRRFISKHSDRSDRAYDIFGVALLGACVFIIVIPPLVFR